ncbi:M20/M25/M40 family metallo-hydrolase, partial [Singulisphaera rosea]
AFGQLDQRLSADPDPICGPASVFIGQIHSGEIYNQYPQECWLQGTRRWLPGTSHLDVEREFRSILEDVATSTRTNIDCEWIVIRDAFHLEENDPVVQDFQDAYSSVAGQPLPSGPKPFVDDGNSFWANAGVAAITHGPRAGGQHTIDEWVSIEDLVRVARVYALTAVAYCQGQ